ncbi:hypothetical protein SAMN05444409_3773 [Epilithonimonas zeae]|uniref:Lipoprotein n=1 Tax=Epilithonimonas zeae TaxID=1416779 RepID=A0A1N6JT37_9FLAO|nr:hypothetical protein SAMN05444409_3773 [Epilithonimonas zeae]
MNRRNIGILMIEVKMMRKLSIILIGAVFLSSCTVAKPTDETGKGFFLKWKHKKDNEK